MTVSRPSLRRHLLLMLLTSILLVWLVVLFLVYRTAAGEIQGVFDRDLERSARILQSLLLHEVGEEAEMVERAQAMVAELGAEIGRFPTLAAILDKYSEIPAEEKLELVQLAGRAGHRHGKGLTFIARHGNGSVILRDQSAPDIPLTSDGFTDLDIGGEAWRIFGLRDERAGFLVQTGEPLAARGELARLVTRNTLAPMLFALPPLGLLIWLVVGRALAPLQRIAGEVSQRAPEALESIDELRAPREIEVLISALNALFGRLDEVIRRERRFTADAAHELRTPLAALKTNLQVAEIQAKDQSTRELLNAALASVDRASHSVSQLLALARADAQGGGTPMRETVDLRELSRRAVAELSGAAIEKGVDLGAGEGEPVRIPGDPGALQILLRNLVDNAVRYTPAGGTVTVEVGAGNGVAWLEVLDDGPGVPEAEHERIFDRFHRGPPDLIANSSGSGLGLSIVRRIALLHGAQVASGEGLGGRGFGIRVTFPAFADKQGSPAA